MEIKLNAKVDSLPNVAANSVRQRSTSTPLDAAEFEQSRALEGRLQGAPEIRAQLVANAKQLVSDVNYPSAETIHKIASLLALNLDSAE